MKVSPMARNIVLLLIVIIIYGCSDTTGPNDETDIRYLSGNIAENTRLTADISYYLTGQVFVNAGVTLTIEPGVTINAIPYDKNGLPTALIIDRNARIIADGTSDKPITFTSSLPDPQAGSWGGLVILGNAPVNMGAGENFVEGLSGRIYGGDDPDDDSGILRYVRVWYGGRAIGHDIDLSGIVLAGVGRGTTVDHCEVAFNHDDGFELFGGTVDLKYCSALFVGGSGFDADLGYSGRCQFLFVMTGEHLGDIGIGIANYDENMNAQPRTQPVIHNVTLVGSGEDSFANNETLIEIQDGAGGFFGNMILVEGKEYGVIIESDESLVLIGNELLFSKNNIVYNCYEGQFEEDYSLTALDINPLLRSLDGREEGGIIDPRPSGSGPAVLDIDPIPVDDFFIQADFKGAFHPEEGLWLQGWSWLDSAGRLP